jgi:hypothetical protein
MGFIPKNGLFPIYITNERFNFVFNKDPMWVVEFCEGAYFEPKSYFRTLLLLFICEGATKSFFFYYYFFFEIREVDF